MGGVKMTIGERLLMFRAKYNLTQKQMSKLIDENINMLYRYENGNNKPHKKNELRILMKLEKLEKERENNV